MNRRIAKGLAGVALCAVFTASIVGCYDYDHWREHDRYRYGYGHDRDDWGYRHGWDRDDYWRYRYRHDRDYDHDND